MSNFSNFFDMEKMTSMVNKVKNAVMNYTEYEAKVRDATNNEPWGASSTLMMDIANATHHFQHFHDIMNTIYKRLQEPPSSTWRQTYKALQLLEYLIKNGSEKVIDAARDHQYELRALNNYQYTDEKHKDQGINVRNRAKEILDLVASDDKLRAERQKAKENRAKYKGVSGDQMSSGGFSSGGYSSSGFGGSGKKYGGFGSDSYNHQSSYDFQSSSSYNDSGYRESGSGSFHQASSSSLNENVTSSTSTTKQTQNTTVKQPVAAPKVADLLDVNPTQSNDDEWSDFTGATSDSVVQPQPVTNHTAPSNPMDDFTDFQSVPPPQKLQSSFSPVNGHGNGSAPLGFAAFTAPQNSIQSQASLATPLSAIGNFGPVQGAPVHLGPAPMASSHHVTSPGIGFANFSTAGAAIPRTSTNIANSNTSTQQSSSSDPFASLVSLDAKSLTPGAKKEPAPSGPTLNAIGASQHAMNPSLIGPSGSRNSNNAPISW